MDDSVGGASQAPVRQLRAAILSGIGVEDALRQVFGQDPIFAMTLLAGAVDEYFGSDADVRDITRFMAKIAAERTGDSVFRAGEGELITRVLAGETGLARHVDSARADYAEIAIAVLSSLLAAWRPGTDEVDALIGVASGAAALTREVFPESASRLDAHVSGVGTDAVPSTAAAVDGDEASQIRHRALELTAEGRYEEALAAYDRVLGLDPHDVSALINRGTTENQLGRHGEALADFSRAIELDPGSAQAFYGRGETYQFMERYDEALADLDHALDLDPRDIWALASRGMIYCLLGRYEDSLADYTRAIDMDDTTAVLLAGRADTRVMIGEYDEALADYARAIGLDPGSVDAIASRGSCYLELGRYDDALADLTRAFDLEPQGWILANRAETYRLMGRSDEARADYRRAIELDPELAEELGDNLAQ